MDKKRERKLDELIDVCWAHHAWVKGLRCNCNFEHPDPSDPDLSVPDSDFQKITPDNEIPILWFGSMKDYEDSPRKIVTVGLNPSDMEFSKTRPDRDEGKCDMFRFKEAESFIDGTVTRLDAANKLIYKNALNHYFPKPNKERLPKQNEDEKESDTAYWDWFGKWTGFLNSLEASYCPKLMKNTVIHTDFCTPVATTPAWRKFGELRPCVRDAIERDARKRELWKRLIEILRPELILAITEEGKMKAMANCLSLKQCETSTINGKKKSLKLFHWEGSIDSHNVHLFGSPQINYPWGGWHEPQINKAKRIIETFICGKRKWTSSPTHSR